jgi:hypothetical protein
MKRWDLKRSPIIKILAINSIDGIPLDGMNYN